MSDKFPLLKASDDPRQTQCGSIEEVPADKHPDIWAVYRDALPGTLQILAKAKDGVHSGSGFVADEKGRVITNCHVVDGASYITALTPDGAFRDIELKDVDPKEDLAVLQLGSGKSYVKPLALKDAADIKVGDDVVALGHPAGVLNLVASSGTLEGRVSRATAILRENPAAGCYDIAKSLLAAPIGSQRSTIEWLSTPVLDAHLPLYHGNSGGPVVDRQGKVAGVAQGLLEGNLSHSMLVPSDKVRALLDRQTPGYVIKHSYTRCSDWDLNRLSGGHLVSFSPLENDVITDAGGPLLAFAAVKGMRRAPFSTSLAIGMGSIGLLTHDYACYRDAFDTRSQWKYGLAATSDAAMAGGALLTFAARMACTNPRVRTIGSVLMAAGAIGRYGATFIPNHIGPLIEFREADKINGN